MPDQKDNPSASVEQDDDPTALVQRGYDRVAERYLACATASPTRERYLQATIHRLPPAARVLELGCGAGIPVARTLRQQAEVEVVGVDISATQIALARQHVPSATFIQADLTQVDFPAAAFDAIVAFYAITHVPRAAHAGIFDHIARWLKPGGTFTASLGAEDDPGTVEPDWLGEPMFFSHFPADENRRLVRQSGLRLLQDEVVAEDEDGVPVRFLWVLATKFPGA